MLVDADGVEAALGGVFELVHEVVVHVMRPAWVEQRRMDVDPHRGMLLTKIIGQLGIRHQVEPADLHGTSRGAAIGAVTGHVKGGMSNADLRSLGEVLNNGQAGLIAVHAWHIPLAAISRAGSPSPVPDLAATAAEAARQGWRVVALTFDHATGLDPHVEAVVPSSIADIQAVLKTLTDQAVQAALFVGKFWKKQVFDHLEGADEAGSRLAAFSLKGDAA